MIIGSDFSNKNRDLLREIGRLSEGDTDKKIPVKEVNESIGMDRTELKHLLEHLEGLGLIQIATIGGPLLYGHVKITEPGLEKYHEIT